MEISTRSCLQILEEPINLMWLFLYKGHRTNKIRKTDKTKEIILWLSHLTADLKHIDNKNLKKNIISKMFGTMTPATIWSFQQKLTKSYLILKLLPYK